MLSDHRRVPPSSTTPLPYVNSNTVSRPKPLPNTNAKPKQQSKLTDLPDPPTDINFALLDKNQELFATRELMVHRCAIIGTGGFARCYEARDANNRKFALKIVDKSIIKTEKHQQKLRHEVRIQGRMRHPNIVELFGWKEDELHVHILLELCPNRSLQELVKARKRLNESESARFFHDLVQGVNYMHERNVIHRDLKLGNVFLTQDLCAKIGDFGLATEITSDTDRKLTMCGTPNYIAPEILAGKSAGGHSFEVDIWSLGVILYSMLIGRPPFQMSDVKKIYDRIQILDYEFPPAIPISTHPKELITSMLQKLPSARPVIAHLLTHPFVVSGVRIPDDSTLSLSEPANANNTSTTISSSRRNSLIRRNVDYSSSHSPKTKIGTEKKGTRLDDNYDTLTPPNSDRNTSRLNKLIQPAHSLIPSRSHNAISIPRPNTAQDPKRGPLAYYTIEPDIEAISKSFSETRVTSDKKYVPNQDSPAHSTAEHKIVRTRSQSKTVPAAVSTELTSHTANGEANKNDTPGSTVPSMIEAIYSNMSTAWTYVQSMTPTNVPRPSSNPLEKKFRLSQSVVNEPIVYVAKCIDYCEKYGLGYQLSNGVTGVYFNDMTVLTLSANKTRIEYMYHVVPTDTPRTMKRGAMKRQCFKITEYPPELQKKMTLLNHFSNYMETHMVALPVTGGSEGTGLVFLTKFYHGLGAVQYHAYRLSNHVFQINFADHGKLVLIRDAQVILYVDTARNKYVLQLADLPAIHRQAYGGSADVLPSSAVALDFLNRFTVTKNMIAKIRERRGAV